MAIEEKHGESDCHSQSAAAPAIGCNAEKDRVENAAGAEGYA